MAGFRSLFTSVRRPPPTPPIPFGYKMSWLALRATDVDVVARALRARSRNPATWNDGIEAAYEAGFDDGIVFITPPIRGWIAVVGLWSSGSDRASLDRLRDTITALSARFGEAQGFASHRVVEYHHWMLAKDGKLARRFAYLGESGEVLAEDGAPIEPEPQLRAEHLARFPDAKLDPWTPDEKAVMRIAAAWSYDPTQLSEKSAPPANGIIAKVK